MNSRERAAARTGAPDLGTNGKSAGTGEALPASESDAEWADLVAGIEQTLIEIPEETTEKASVPELSGDTDEFAVPEPVPHAPDSDARVRERRSTVVSPIPAMLAQSMGKVPDLAPTNRPGVPQVSTGEITRPVPNGVPIDQSEDRVSSGYAEVEVIDGSTVDERKVTADLIARARACLAEGNLAGAVLAVDEVMGGVEKTTMPGIADLIESARPMFDHVFASYLGLLGRVPVMARSDEEVADLSLDGRTRLLLSYIDGRRTLEQIFGASKVPAVDAVRIAASLMCSGIIRVL